MDGVGEQRGGICGETRERLDGHEAKVEGDGYAIAFVARRGMVVVVGVVFVVRVAVHKVLCFESSRATSHTSGPDSGDQISVIPDARSAIRNPGATSTVSYDPLGSGFSLREPRNDGVVHKWVNVIGRWHDPSHLESRVLWAPGSPLRGAPGMRESFATVPPRGR